MKESLRSFIGKRIRLLRLQKGLTQEQVEEMADLGTNYVYKLEHLETNMGTSKNTSIASRASNLSLIYSLFLVNFCL